MASSLKMVFNIGSTGKTHTLSIADPKTNLQKATVLAAANEIIAKSAIMVDETAVSTLKEAYIYTTERTELPEG